MAPVRVLRRFFGLPWLLPFTALLLRARTVRPSGAFIAREALRVAGTRTYRLAESGLRVTIRHRTPDVVTLGEVFHNHDYVPDPEIEQVLGDARSIVDLGANVGLFGVFAAARWPASTIVAFEPDPANVAVHQRTIAANRLERRWTLVAAAAGACDGVARFAAGHGSLSRLTDEDAEDAIMVPVEDVLPIVGEADLLKMDIEGGEWVILGDPRFRRRPPRVLVLEYHPYGCPTADPCAAAQAAVTAAGMTVPRVKQLQAGYGILWAWRK